MNNYVRHYCDDDDTEERVHVAQATCYNEEDIEEAIERTKRDLQRTSVPYGYTKIDEEIITTVYKMPENEIIHTSHGSNIDSKYNKQCKYNNIYDDNYESSNVNIQSINGGKIENYFQNEISKDGQYLVSMTMSKKVMDENEQNLRRGIQRNNYYKEEIEIDENDAEGGSPLKESYEYHRRKQPIDVRENEYYETKEQVNSYNYPVKTQKNIYTYYKDNNGNYEKRKRHFEKVYNTQAHSMQFPAKYKKGEFKNNNY
jgi:hypothetical protein